jgi:magnesium transporter
MFFSGRSKKPGSTPGTLVYIGEKRDENAQVAVIDYSSDHYEEKKAASLEDCVPYMEKDSVTWINVSGIHDLSMIESLGKHFDLHPLVLEDIVDTEHRPKLDDYGEYLFIVLKMLHAPEDESAVQEEQVSLILAKGMVISLQEYEGDLFDPVRERLRKAKGRIRSRGSDYLAYALIDVIVDYYFHVFEKFEDRMELLQEWLLSDPKPETLQKIHALKEETILIRKSVWPLREIVNGLSRGDSGLISKEVTVFLRDVYDHTIQVIDTVETTREMLSGMVDIYLSSMSNRMNEVMKVLTIISTIFIPLTFLTGIYGMNFKYMPELESQWGYPALGGVMIVVFISMIAYFKKKHWL